MLPLVLDIIQQKPLQVKPSTVRPKSKSGGCSEPSASLLDPFLGISGDPNYFTSISQNDNTDLTWVVDNGVEILGEQS